MEMSSFRESLLRCAGARVSTPGFSLADADFCVLHSPFVKMVRKAFARLAYQDHLRASARRAAEVLLPLKLRPL